MLVPSSTGLLSIRNRAAGKIGIFISNVPEEKGKAASTPRLLFHRYGDEYYRSEIWAPGFRTGRMISQHPSELAPAKPGEPHHVTLYLSAQGR